MVWWVVGSILHGVDPLSYFSFQPVLHDWCNKGCGMCNPVCGMVHIKEPLLLIGESSLCGSRFPLSLSEWSFTICLTPHKCVECVVNYNIFLPSYCQWFSHCSTKIDLQLFYVTIINDNILWIYKYFYLDLFWFIETEDGFIKVYTRKLGVGDVQNLSGDESDSSVDLGVGDVSVPLIKNIRHLWKVSFLVSVLNTCF